MKNEKFTIVDKIGEDNVVAFRNTASIAIDFEDKTLRFSDLHYSFEEVLSIAEKIKQLQSDREDIGSTVASV